jgi:hypothetical protein
VNLEYLAKVVFTNDDGVLYPDSLVGTDSHTTMSTSNVFTTQPHARSVTRALLAGVDARWIRTGQHSHRVPMRAPMVRLKN